MPPDRRHDMTSTFAPHVIGRVGGLLFGLIVVAGAFLPLANAAGRIIL